IAQLLDLYRGGIGLALVVDPANLQIIALAAALEAELDVGVLGDRRAPVGDEHRSPLMLEGQFLDEMRRNQFAVFALDKARIHRMLNQRLDVGDLSIRYRAHAN